VLQPSAAIFDITMLVTGAMIIAAAWLVHRAFRRRAVLGTITLASLVLGSFFLEWGPVAELGEGGIERWVAYPAVLWLTVFGGYLMGSRTAEAPPAPERGSTAAVRGNGRVPVGTA
jgi:hypothetical protein